MNKVALIFLIAVSHFPMYAFSASYICESKDLNKIESTICENAELSSLDDIMFSIYTTLLKEPSSIQFDLRPDMQLKVSQLEWIKDRNKCPDIACIRNEYIKRTKYLSNRLNVLKEISSKKFVSDIFSHEFGKEDADELASIFFASFEPQKNLVTYLSKFTIPGLGGGGPCAAASDIYIVYLTYNLETKKVINKKHIAAGECNVPYSLYIESINTAWDNNIFAGFQSNDTEEKIPAFKIKIYEGRFVEYTRLNDNPKNLSGWEKNQNY